MKNCALDYIIPEICNIGLTSNDTPSLSTLTQIIPVPKKGNLFKTDNYRDISLMCIVAKLFNRMILLRIRKALEPKLRCNQNGFRPGRTTVAEIPAQRRVMEEARKNNHSAVLTFIDFLKAFDSVNRQKMTQVLKAYGIPTNLLNA